MSPTLYPQGEEGAVRVAEPGAAQVGGPPPDPEGELSPACRGELLDPAAWQEGLEKYSLAMHLAVALVDVGGRLLGPCLNPKPLWGLLRARRPAGAGECPFALGPVLVCTCVADALHRGRVVRARDRTTTQDTGCPDRCISRCPSRGDRQIRKVAIRPRAAGKQSRNPPDGADAPP